jgi:restriction endonuclease
MSRHQIGCMSKKGRPYEQVVAAVFEAFDPRASIARGKWVVGPDGRRELDVLIEGTAGGHPTKGIVECKDFNPSRTGPVGIAYIDALDSKRRDLAAQFALICSNAGFTTDAIRKAKRVGIGLIGVMRKGDKRLRFSVVDEIYTRRLRVASISLTLIGATPIVLSGVPFNDVLYQGIPVANWILHRIMLILGANPIVSGSFTATHELTAPLLFEWPGGSAEAANLSFAVSVEGAWFAHRVKIDSTAGIYDWLRRRVRLALGGGQLQIGEINLEDGERISRPPDRELIRERFLQGEVDVKFLLFENFPDPKPVPDLDRFVVPKDLEFILTDLPPEISVSTSAATTASA